MPATFVTVDEFLDAQSEHRRAEVQALREIVLGSTAGVQEHIKWNSPSYFLVPGADRVTVNAQGKSSARLILHAGATTAEDKSAAPTFGGDPDGVLIWQSNIRASLVVGDIESITLNQDRIAAIVRRWFAEMP